MVEDGFFHVLLISNWLNRHILVVVIQIVQAEWIIYK